jgi:hypothetical protein
VSRIFAAAEFLLIFHRIHLAVALAGAGIAAMLLSAPARAEQKDWIDLLPDTTLQGWTRIPIPAIDGLKPKQQWRVDESQHALVCSGDGGHEWLRYDKELGDFILQVDWRFTPRGPDEKKYNSGIGIRMTKLGEIWHQAQTGLTGGFLFGDHVVDGATKRFRLFDQMTENRIKPAGEWNRYEITATGDRITLSVNGKVVNEVTGCGLRRGYIGLEAEGYEVTFRNIKVKLLD